MSIIESALQGFTKLLDFQYSFTIAYQKQIHNIVLNFNKKDFFHSAGFQYLKDIDIPKTPDHLFAKIRNGEINDKYLESSEFYKKVKDSYANVKSRIWGLQFIEEYLENRNLVCRYIKNKNIYSTIDADYLIKSTVYHKTAYIFLKRRKNRNEYCICSFFVEPKTDYNGIKAYWLFKAKINLITKEERVLYNRLNANGESDSVHEETTEQKIT